MTELSDNGKNWYKINSVPRKNFSRLKIGMEQKGTELNVLRGFDNFWMMINDSPGGVSTWQCVENPTSLFVDVSTCTGEYVDTLIEVEFGKMPIRLYDSFFVKQRQILRFRFTFENTEGYDNVRISLDDLASIRIRNIGESNLCLEKFLLQVDHLAIDLVEEESENGILLIPAGVSFTVPFKQIQQLLNVNPSSCCRNATDDSDNSSSYREIRQQHLQPVRSLVSLRKLPNYFFGTVGAGAETCQTCYGSSICDPVKSTCVCGGNRDFKGNCSPKKICRCPVGSYCGSSERESEKCHLICKEGFERVGNFRCENIDECSRVPSVCSKNFLCVDLIGTFECLPPVLSHNSSSIATNRMEDLKLTEFLSVRQCKLGYRTVANFEEGHFSCEDIDECQDSTMTVLYIFYKRGFFESR